MSRHLLRAAAEWTRRAGIIRVRTVLNPLLWMIPPSTAAGLIGGWLSGFETWLGVSVTLLGFAPIAVALVVYVWFALREPDRLQSEEYILQQTELRLAERRFGPVGDPRRLPAGEVLDEDAEEGEYG